MADTTRRPTPYLLTRTPRPGPAGFELLGELGRGGMGVVYKARQLELNRVVALKMILSGAHVHESDKLRFLSEAEAIASVRHPNVVQVYEFGEYDGRPYFALEYLDGGSLSCVLAEHGRLAARPAARIVELVAEGVQAAHDVGLVHRDLKPGNILLTGVRSQESGDRKTGTPGRSSLTPDSCPLTPKVTDFGLAKRATSADLTITGMVMGTPAYMAPEQAAGRAKCVGPAADIYALGVILYELVTGRTPFVEEEPAALIARVAFEDPPPVRQFAPDAPRDLELICMKCLAKTPAERYASAALLAEDLARFRTGEPVSVRPPGKVEKAIRWVRRDPRRAVAYALTLVTAALIGLTAGAMKLLREADAAKKQAVSSKDAAEGLRGDAEAARARAESAERQLKDEVSLRAVELANRAFDGFDIPRARELLDAAGPEARHWGWHYLDRAVASRERRTTPTGDRNTFTLAVAPDGRVVTSGDAGVRAWDLAAGTRRVVYPGSHSRIEFSRDGRRLVANDMRQRATVFDAGTWAEVGHFGSFPLAWFSLDPTGERVFKCLNGASAEVCDAATGKIHATFWLAPMAPLCSAFAPDGKSVAVGGVYATGKGPAGGYAQLYAADTGKLGRAFGPHAARVVRMAFANDGSRLATIADDGSVKVWNAETGAAISTLPAAADAWSVAFSADAARLVTGGHDRSVRVWHAATGTELFTFRGHAGGVGDAAFTPDGKTVVSVGMDGTMREWDVSGRPDRVRLAAPRGQVPSPRAPVLLPGGRLFVGGEGKGACYDARTGAAVSFLDPPAPPRVRWAALRNDQLEAVTDTGELWRWDATTGKGGRTNDGPIDDPQQATGAYAATADLRRLLVRLPNLDRVIDRESGAVVCSLAPRVAGAVQAAALSPDGRWAATGGYDRQVHVWDAATGQPAFQLRCLGDTVRGVAFSPDGTKIATASQDGWVQVWDAQARRDILTVRCRGAGSHLTGLAFAADGRELVVLDSVGTAFFLDATPR